MKHTFDVAINTCLQVEVNTTPNDEAEAIECAKNKALDILLHEKSEDIEVTLKSTNPTNWERKNLYHWKATSGHRGNENYEGESAQYFATQEEAYNDMRQAALEKMKWNTEFREDFHEDDCVDYKVVFSKRRIVHTSYSGTYIYEIFKGDTSLYSAMEKRFDEVLSFTKTITEMDEESIDRKAFDQLRAIWTAFCLEFDVQVDTEEYDYDMDQILDELQPILGDSDIFGNPYDRRNADIYFGELLC